MNKKLLKVLAPYSKSSFQKFKKNASGLSSVELITFLIIKITISSIAIGLKNFYFPLIHLPSCYRTVCYRTDCYRTVYYRTVQLANHIQSCSLNQPITFKVVVTCVHARALAFVFLSPNCRQEARWPQNVYISFVGILTQIFPFFHNLAILLLSETVIFMINW